MAKNPAAVALGRRGGKAYVKNSTAEERKAAAKKAAQARWGTKKKPPTSRPSTSFATPSSF